MNDAAIPAASLRANLHLLVRAPKSRSLLAACLTHALHDGYTDGLYAFLPVWQAQFGLSYAALPSSARCISGRWGAADSRPTGLFAASRRARR